jgi:hypothetical protein
MSVIFDISAPIAPESLTPILCHRPQTRMPAGSGTQNDDGNLFFRAQSADKKCKPALATEATCSTEIELDAGWVGENKDPPKRA